jgi:transcriptional regulator with XRE-family HTH domain
MEKALFSDKYRRLLEWLKAGREAKGLTIRQLAELLGESHSVVGKIEIGERRLDVFEYIQFCEVLELKPQDGIRLMARIVG